MRVAVIEYPGSSCRDVLRILQTYLGVDGFSIWHEEEDLKDPNLVVLPGGSSFGDYLRPGGLAKGSVIGGALRRFARDNGQILGIGNGFQILCELGLLPGAFLPNASLSFQSEWVYVTSDSDKHTILKANPIGTVYHLPIACSHGRYYVDQRTLNELESGNLIALRYCDKDGDCDFEKNYNGSVRSIAGVISRGENVLGMMVHPERALDVLMGGVDGRKLLMTLSA